MHTLAIQAALALFREPARIVDFRERPLPDDVGLIIRIAAGETASINDAADSTEESSATLIEASVFYLQQMLFVANGDSYRTLGLSSEAPQEQLREHHRWLMRWLHPDRNPDGWEVVYADRVNAAWQDLKTPQRRAEYDERLPVADASFALAVVQAPVLRVRTPPPESARPWLTGTMVRRLPSIIFGTLSVMAITVLGVMYWAKSGSQQDAGFASVRDDPSHRAERVDKRADVAPLTVAVPAKEAGSEASVPTDLSPVVSPASVPIDTPVRAPAITAPNAVIEDAAAALAQLAAENIELERALNQRRVDEALAAQERLALLLQVERDRAQRLTDEKRIVESRLAESIQQTLPEKLTTTPASEKPSAGNLAHASTSASAEHLAAQDASLGIPATLEPTVAPTQPDVTVVKVAQAEPPAPGAAQNLVGEMVAAYASGNLARFDRLFALESAKSDGALSLRRRMQSTQMRYLEMGDVDWNLTTDSAVGRVKFRDTFVPRGEKKSVTRAGEIRLIVRVDSGMARISSLEVASVDSN